MVDSLADRIDVDPADGVCADVVSSCTLPAAISEANASPGDDAIQLAVSGTIVLRATLPEVADARTGGRLEIDGGGQVTVSGNDSVRILSVASGGNLTLRNMRLERGREESLLGGGGAIYSEGTLTIENSTFSGNSAEDGGARYNTGELRVVNVTLPENATTEDGGGFFHDSPSNVADIVFSTFYLNTAGGRGSAIFDAVDATRIKNSIVVGSGSTGNCFDAFASRGRNYSTDATCPGFTVATRDALRLGPLADKPGCNRNPRAAYR